MKGKTFKVRVILDSKNEPFAKALPVGHETMLTSILSDKREKISNAVHNLKTGEEVFPAEYREKGTYLDYTVTGIDGQEYCGRWIEQIIGHKPITQIFKKVN
jgi:hypothetical protein